MNRNANLPQDDVIYRCNLDYRYRLCVDDELYRSFLVMFVSYCFVQIIITIIHNIVLKIHLSLKRRVTL